jgi:hypothetical protein
MELKIGLSDGAVVSENHVEGAPVSRDSFFHHGGYLVAQAHSKKLAPLFSLSFRSAEIVEFLVKANSLGLTEDSKSEVFDQIVNISNILWKAGLKSALEEARSLEEST